ncbi:MAG: T9SS type A sorting domain-containing protein [Chlorobi bacterium]|nr:T9SS type A sorting domain-containing protein [Chlorobiota bacterium]MCI0717265.1 T9SS type A sorting domain-containing protein [Chlorobiota bacterium]
MQIAMHNYKITMVDQIPFEFRLYQNFPQSFYKVTKIGFDLPEDCRVKLLIYDVFGREISVLVDQNLKAGSYEVKWNALKVSPGIYYYKVIAGDYIDSKKMFLLKNN